MRGEQPGLGVLVVPGGDAALLAVAVRGFVVALEREDDAERPQGAGVVGARRVMGVDGAFQEVAGLVQMAAAAPEQPGAARHFHGGRRVAAQQVLDRGAQVGVRVGDPAVPGDLARAQPARVRLPGQLGEVRRVPVGDEPFLAEFGEPHGAVLAQRVQHPVAAAVLPEHGLGDESGERRRDVGGGERTARTDGDGVLGVDLAPEDGEPGPEQAFEGRAEFVAPADGRAQGAVPLGPDVLVGEDVEPGGEPGGDLFDAAVAEPGAGEFDGERDAFESAADLGGGACRARVVEAELRCDTPGPVAEELEGVLVAVQRERRDVDAVFVRGAERMSAGGEDGEAGGRGEQFADEMAAGVHEPFAAVEDEQQLSVREPFAERLDGAARGVVEESDGLGDGGEQQPLVVERREVDPGDCVGAPLDRRTGSAQGEVEALADATAADQGDQPVLLDRCFQDGQFCPAPHEAGRLMRKVSHHGTQFGVVVARCRHPWRDLSQTR